ncbi:MAG: DUF2147 domain-containing protein [Deltaproteobacteria bacterium]|nr:DUF2147 domain-containing protein [Deltaproteobacteria bacterium]MBI4224053.1 DUF2147 domain-containing protein [Deltaproteobacteria bacterium]
MKTKLWLAAWLAGISVSIAAAAGSGKKDSPVGYWKTISDKTDKPRSVVQVYESGGVVYGKIVKSLVPGEGPGDLCEKCEGEFHNQPVIGMRFMWGLQEDEDGVWKEGRILDPDSGKTYKCKITLLPEGDQLKVRGYIGFSLLGRNQVWHRVRSPAAAGSN